MSATTKNMDPTVTEIKCKTKSGGISNNGAMTVATSNLEKTVKLSDTGKDLQKIMLLSFLSSKNVVRLKAKIANPSAITKGAPKTTSPALIALLLCSKVDSLIAWATF